MAEISPAEHLRNILTPHVGVSGWQIEIGAMPPEPDRVIMISDTVSPLEPNPKWALDFPTCQALIRGEVSGYKVTFQESKAVKDLLLGIDSYTTTDGDRIVSITMNGDLGFIGRDDSMRPMFSINFAMIIEPQDSPNSNRFLLSGATLGFDDGFSTGFG